MRLPHGVAGPVARRSVRLRRLLVLGVVIVLPGLAGFQVAAKQSATTQDPTKSVLKTPAGSQGGSRQLLSQSTPAPPPYVFPPESTAKICAQVDTTAGGAQLRALMDSLKWVAGCLPMFTDDQRLFTPRGEFGPLAHIVPAPGDSLHRIQDFDVPLERSILVGLILVDTNAAPLPETYEALYLNPGFSCVYFRHTGEDPFDGWRAYVTKLLAIRPVNYCAKPVKEQNLRVIPYHDRAFTAETDYPLIARFREATYQGRNHWPLFGLKCVTAFCIVSGDTSNKDPHKSEHRGYKTSVKTWQVFGWNDEQHPAVGNGKAKPQWDFNASIVAVPNLGDLKIADFDKDTVHVSTVFLRKSPPKGSKYDTLWHYQKGENYILLHHDATAGRDSGWTGVIRHRLVPTALDKLLAAIGYPYQWRLYVRRMDHSGISVLGTARFKWSPNDDNDWARCDAGCCEVTPTPF